MGTGKRKKNCQKTPHVINRCKNKVVIRDKILQYLVTVLIMKADASYLIALPRTLQCEFMSAFFCCGFFHFSF